MTGHVGELASAYLDGETTAEESAKVVAHVAECASCRDELADLHAARSALRGLPVLEMPVSVMVDMGLVPDVVPLRRRPIAWVAAAAASVAIFIGGATLAAPETVGIPLDDVSSQYEQQVRIDPGLTPPVGVVTEPEGAQ